MSVVIPNQARPSRWLLPPSRVEQFKLLGTRLRENLKWMEHLNAFTSSCYKVLTPTRKVKNTYGAEQRRQGDPVWTSETRSCDLEFSMQGFLHFGVVTSYGR